MLNVKGFLVILFTFSSLFLYAQIESPVADTALQSARSFIKFKRGLNVDSTYTNIAPGSSPREGGSTWFGPSTAA